jgi:serine/threonine protein kinase
MRVLGGKRVVGGAGEDGPMEVDSSSLSLCGSDEVALQKGEQADAQQQQQQQQQLQQDQSHHQQQCLSSAMADATQANVVVVGFAAVGGDAGQDPYTTFLLSVAARRKDGAFAKWTVYRRFSAFLLLLQRLERCDSWLVSRAPAFPPKSMTLLGHSDAFLVLRAHGLCAWLRSVIAMALRRPASAGLVSVFLTEEADFAPPAIGRIVAVEPVGVLGASPGSDESGLESSQEHEQLDLQLQQQQNLDPNIPPRLTGLDKAAEQQQHEQEQQHQDRLRHAQRAGNGGPGGASPLRAQDETGSGITSLEDLRLLKLVGKGSFGQVFLAEPAAAPQLEGSPPCFAVKVLDKAEMVQRRQLARVELERHCMSLAEGCPFIVQLQAAFQNDTHLFLVQDFCPGGELYYHLDLQSKLSPKLARFYAAECAIALQHLHARGVVYRDLKPENIMLAADGHVKLVDFGLSKAGVRHALRGALSFVGTMEYMAPEMIAKTGHGFAVDWWSLGMVLFEMLTGIPPWFSEDRATVLFSIQHADVAFPQGQVSSSARAILRALLVKDARQRLGSARGLQELAEHVYFEPLDFAKLERKLIRPPFVPALQDSADTSLFDIAFTSQPVNLHVYKSPDPQHSCLAVQRAEQDGLFHGFRRV